jgi:hypothetical protein
MRSALDPAGHRVPQTKPTCLLHTWRPQRRRPFALVLHLHQHQSSRYLHLQYLAKNQFTQRCQSLITQGSDHPPFLEPHMVLSGSPELGGSGDALGRGRGGGGRGVHLLSVCGRSVGRGISDELARRPQLTPTVRPPTPASFRPGHGKGAVWKI